MAATLSRSHFVKESQTGYNAEQLLIALLRCRNYHVYFTCTPASFKDMVTRVIF